MSATAKGKLAATPLWELLIFCLERKLSGSLVIESPGVGRSALSLRNGSVIKAKLAVRQHLLGELCVELQLISATQLEAVVGQSAKGLIGQAIRDQGLISNEQLRDVLIEQLVRQVEWCASLPGESIYGYYGSNDVLARWGGNGLSVDPLKLISRAAKVSMNPQKAHAVVASLGTRVLRLHPRAGVLRFDFGDEYRGALDVLRVKPQPFEELLATGLLPRQQLSTMIALLAMTRHLDLGLNAAPLGVDAARSGSSQESIAVVRAGVQKNRPAPEPAAPVEESAEISARRQEVLETAQRLQSLDLYATLGVANDADAAAVQAAFFQLARKWHPDKLPTELRDLREAATKVFARMTEAHQVLTNPEQRRQYDELAAQGATADDEQRKVRQVLEAATAFQKAEVLARKGDWKSAIEHSKQAYDDDPEQLEYGALYAWAVAKSGQRAQEANYADLLEILNDAVKQMPDNLRVRLYRADVLKLAGKSNLAIRDYRYVNDADPKNVEAAREIRLYKMRAEGSGGENEGLFGKLFKK